MARRRRPVSPSSSIVPSCWSRISRLEEKGTQAGVKLPLLCHFLTADHNPPLLTLEFCGFLLVILFHKQKFEMETKIFLYEPHVSKESSERLQAQQIIKRVVRESSLATLKNLF